MIINVILFRLFLRVVLLAKRKFESEMLNIKYKIFSFFLYVIRSPKYTKIVNTVLRCQARGRSGFISCQPF